MPGKLTIVSDFVCPYCYWLEALLDRLEKMSYLKNPSE